MKLFVCILLALTSSCVLSERDAETAASTTTTTEEPNIISYFLELFFRGIQDSFLSNTTADARSTTIDHHRVRRQIGLSPAQLLLLQQRQQQQHNQAIALAQLNQHLLRQQQEEEDDSSEEDDDFDSDEFWDTAPVNDPHKYRFQHPMINGGFSHRSGQVEDAESPKITKSEEEFIVARQATTEATTASTDDTTETDTTSATDSTTETDTTTETTETTETTDSTTETTPYTTDSTTETTPYATDSTTDMTESTTETTTDSGTEEPETTSTSTTTTRRPHRRPPYNATVKCRCGVQSKRSIQFGPTNVETNLQPWLVSINTTQRHLCSGSIINSRYILTAASCVSGFKPSTLRIHAGVSTPSKSVVYTGQRVSVHPLYNPITKSNNLALIEVKPTIITNKYIRFICLPVSERHRDSPGTLVTLMENYRKHSSTLIQEEVQPIWRCRNLPQISARYKVPPGTFCSAPPRTACGGDIGGAFIHPGRGYSFSIEGVISTTAGCKTKKKPAVYTLVSRYIYWILYSSQAGAYCSSPDFRNELLNLREDQPVYDLYDS